MERLTNYLIVSGMLTCAAIGATQLGLQLSPAWNAGYVPLLCFFIALESAVMTRYVRRSKPPVPRYILRGVEGVVLFLMLRALLGVLRGPQHLDIADTFYGRFDSELLALLILAALIWLASWRMTANLLDLEPLDPALDREVILEAAQTQVEIRHDLIMFTLILGVALTFLAGLLRLVVSSERQTVEAPLAGLWHIVLYFFLALALFSRTRLNLLRSGWLWENVPIESGVGARWLTYTWLLLAIGVIIAVALPTHYSLGLLDTLGYLLNFIVAAVQTIAYTILALILQLLSRLLPNLPQPALRPPQETWPFPPPDLPPPTSADFIQSLIFWIVFVGVAGYVVAQYLRQHPDVAGWLKRLPGISLLLRAWRSLREWLGGLNQQIENLREARRLARRSAAARSASASRQWINLRRLSPRQQVQFYYWAMLRRSRESGRARQPAQTPYEYARFLEGQLPEIDHEVDGITGEFVEARYSRHDISSERVSLARRYWERIKRALRR